MAYLTIRETGQRIFSNDDRIGWNVVGDYNRSWTMGEVDTFQFTVTTPNVPIIAGEIYEIWADYAMTFRLGTCYVLSPGKEDFHKHPVDAEGNELFNYNVIGVGPTHFLRQRLINVVRANILISDLAKLIVQKGGLPYGIRDDFSYVDAVDFRLNVRFVDKTAYAILNQLRDLGIGFYVDDDFYFHFFEDKGDVLPYSWDDKTTYIQRMPLSEDITNLRNAVKIIGKDIPKKAPDFLVIGTGDLTSGLDFNLPHNVKFDEDTLLEDWGEIDPSLWQVSDSKDSTAELSPDGSRIWNGNSSLHLDGGNGFLGANFIQSVFYHKRREGNAIVQTMSFSGQGEGFVLATGDGNGAEAGQLKGFYLKNGQITIREFGEELTPNPAIPVKQSFGEDSNVVISNLSVDRKTFTISKPVGLLLEVGALISIVGEGIGLHESRVTARTTTTVTIADAIAADADIANAKLIRLASYRLVIVEKPRGFIYKIQGEEYGRLNQGSYQVIMETDADDTEFIYTVPASVRTDDCIIDIEDTFINPGAGATFVRDGEILLVAPEPEGQAFDFPVLIRAADAHRNPPLFRYRPQRFIATVMDATSTTSLFRVTKNDWDDMFVGDRLLVNKKETFVLNKTQIGTGDAATYQIQVSPALPAPPAERDFVYVGTTAAAEGQNGVFSYSYPVPNRRLFKDNNSIQIYGQIEDEPIIDANLVNSTDMNSRFEAFKEAKTTPQIVGTVTFEFSPNLNEGFNV